MGQEAKERAVGLRCGCILLFLVSSVLAGTAVEDEAGPVFPGDCSGPSHYRLSGVPGGDYYYCDSPGQRIPIGAVTAPLGPQHQSGRQRAHAAEGPSISITKFGAKGDGRADDYGPLQAAAEYLCRAPGTTLIFPPGTYRIAQYRILGGSHGKRVRNIRYIGCKGVTISGYGATIDVFGTFHRSADFRYRGHLGSHAVAVTPFEMIDSSDFRIEGFELNGNADKMTRDPAVAEGDNAGILTTKCRNYTIEDVHVHHFQTDGIKLGGNSVIADRAAVLRNVTAENNGRLGLAIIQLRTAVILDSAFSNNGRTGKYGFHDPAAGVDVEPNRTVPDVDVKTGSITFSSCHFEENVGAQFVSIWPAMVDSIFVEKSTIRALSRDTSPIAFLNVPAVGSVTKSVFELGHGHTVALGCRKPERCSDVTRLVYEDNDFRLADRSGLFTAEVRGPRRIQPIEFIRNRVSVNSTAPENSPLLFANVDRVEENAFFVGAKGYAGSGGTGPWAVAYTNVRSVRGNVYSTDLTGSHAYQIIYDRTGGVPTEGEKFHSAPHFRGLSIRRYQSGNK